MPVTWRWDESIMRYRGSDGKLLKRERAMELAAQSIASSASAVDTIAGYVVNGQLASGEFRELFWRELRGEYIRQYLSAIGGKNAMTPADWGRIGGMLKEQKKYFDRFISELGGLSEGQIRARAQMYIASAHEAFERARSVIAQRWGGDEVKWNLGIVVTEHCNLCPRWASMGWQPVGPNGGFPTDDGESTPGDGRSCEGLVNCKCYLTYRMSESGKIWQG